MKINIQNNFKRVFAFLKLNAQKRVLPLLVALAMLIGCVGGLCLPAQAADGVIVDFSVSNVISTVSPELFFAYRKVLYETNAGDKFYSILTNLPAGCVLITSFGYASSTYYGVYFDDNGSLVLGQFVHPGYSVVRSFLGVHYLSELVCSNSWQCVISSCPVFFDYELAVTYSHTTDVVWIHNGEESYFYYSKLSSGEFTATSKTSSISVSGSLSFDETFYSPFGSGYWTFYTEYQNISVTDDGDVAELKVYNYSTSPLYPGLSQGYNVALNGVDLTAEEIVEQITWSVTGAASAITAIDENGMLTVGPDETATMLTITATLNEDTSVVSSLDVAITPLPSADDLTILPAVDEYELGQEHIIQFYAILPDGSKFEHPGLYWDRVCGIDNADYYTMSEDGILTISANAPASACMVRCGFTWGDTMLQFKNIRLVEAVDDNTGSGGGSTGDISGDATTDNDPTDEKLDDIISGGEAGEELGNTSGELDNKNEELGGVMDEYENAQNQMPTTPSDVSGLVNMDDFNAAVDTLALVLKWDEMGIAGMYIPMAMVLGVAALCYIVFGKKG